MNITGQPIRQKPEKCPPNAKHLAKVRALPCAGCGKPGPSEAHHCRDLPDYDERGLYKRIPGAAMKSADEDAIPLCPEHHWLFHNRRSEFHERYGRDYGHIGPTRAAIADLELDF